MTYHLHHGDCVEVMRSLPSESVDAIVTSPPYAEQRKSTYGGIPEKDYPEWTVAWMNEARRLLKPDGSVIINITPHAKNGQLGDYVLRTRLALRGDRWCELDEMVWIKSRTFPSGNMTRPQRAWESLLWYSPTTKPWSDPLTCGNQEPLSTTAAMTRAGKSLDAYGWTHYSADANRADTGAARRRNFVKMAPGGHGPDSGWKHPAPFPPALAEWCGKLICPPGGTILDPFNGSASTGVAAIRNGWDYIGIDAVQEYIDMSEQRLLHVTQQMEQEAA